MLVGVSYLLNYLVGLSWVEENDLFAMGCDGFGVVFNPLARLHQS